MYFKFILYLKNKYFIKFLTTFQQFYQQHKKKQFTYKKYSNKE